MFIRIAAWVCTIAYSRATGFILSRHSKDVITSVT